MEQIVLGPSWTLTPYEVVDGNHRLAAAIYRRDPWVLVCWTFYEATLHNLPIEGPKPTREPPPPRGRPLCSVVESVWGYAPQGGT